LQNNIFSGLFVGQNFIRIKQVDSTNNFLKELASNSKPLIEGTVIMAENQYAGRGQQQNGWHAEPGKNLTFSILLKPTFLPVADQFDLVRAVSLGVFDKNDADSSLMKEMKSVDLVKTFAVTLEPRGGSINPTMSKMMVAGNL